MHELLREELKKRGWQSGTYRGFLRQVRGGLEWEVGVGRSGRMELRWRYRTEGSEKTGEETLSANPTRAEIEDTMTSVYLRVHNRPDPTRVFGGGKRGAPARPAASATGEPVAPAPSPEEAGQGTLDF